MTKHTPGPWRLTEIPQGKRGAAGEWLIRTDNATVLAILSHGKPELEANARLIAAAPELLEALKNIENDDGSIPETIWAMCKAAIAKAEGR